MNIVILGPPGSGKGTQARIISNIYGLNVVDTGKLLRKAVVSDETLLKNINLGNLLSDDFVIKIVTGHLLTLNCDFVLDGFPRTLVQANALVDFVKVNCISINCLVKIDVDDDLIIRRLSTRFTCSKCGGIFSQNLLNCSECGSDKIKKRDDDCDFGAVKHRIEQYKNEISFLDSFFLNLGLKVIIVDGSQSVDKVTKDIQKELF